MLVPLLQVLFVAIRTVFRSAVNIMLYSTLSRIFTRWLGLNTFVSFFCSTYCLSKTVAYFKRLWLNARLNNKKPDEKITIDELTWESTTKMKSLDKFEVDWNYLLDDDTKSIFPSIINIPFNNGWLFFATIILIDYQINNFDYSYFISLVRTIGFLIILICGSSIRYQTLFERDKKNISNLMIKNRDEIECYIVYSTNNSLPIASICLQIINTSESSIFMVHLYQLNSKFDDYVYDIGNYICQKLIDRVKTYGNENKQSVHVIWPLPTCKQNWKFALKANRFLQGNTYKDFSFMPLVNSYIEEHKYFYEYKDTSLEIVNE